MNISNPVATLHNATYQVKIFCTQSGTNANVNIKELFRKTAGLAHIRLSMVYTMMYFQKIRHPQQNASRDRLCRMIRWVVREVAERAGIRNARELAARTGLPPTSVYRIWTDKATRTDLVTIDKLCTALEVKPGQLFEHEAEPDRLPKPELTRRYRRPAAR